MSTNQFKAQNPNLTGSKIYDLKIAHWKTLTDEQKQGWSQILNPTIIQNQNLLKDQHKGQTKETNELAFRKLKKNVIKKTGYDIFESVSIKNVLKKQPYLNKEQAINFLKNTWELLDAGVRKYYNQQANQENEQSSDEPRSSSSDQ